MVMRGRKPKPTAAKRLAGNPGRRRLNENEPQIKSKKLPSCPRHLDKEARKEWRRLAKQLAEAGILTEIDRAVFAAYCRAWSLYVKADQAVQQYGSIFISKNKQPYQSPYLNQMTAAMKDMVRFAAELGMTPSSRSRVKAAKTTTGSALLDFLNGQTSNPN